MSEITIKTKALQGLNKKQLVEEGETHARELMADGYHDAADLVIKARKALEYLSAFVGALESDAREEVARHSGTLELLGAKLELSSTGDRLDYSQDRTWYELKKRLGERELLLKHAHKVEHDTTDANGETVPRVRLASASREVLKVKL